MAPLGAVVGVGLGLLGVALLARGYRRRTDDRPRVAGTPVVPTGEVGPGPVAVRGVVRPAGDTIDVETTGQDGVVVATVAQRYEASVDAPEDEWETIHEGVRSRPFFVEDDDGRVAVDLPDDPTVGVSMRWTEVSGSPDEVPEGIERYRARIGDEDRGWGWSIEDAGRYGQGAIEPGDEVFLRGEAVDPDDGPPAIAGDGVETVVTDGSVRARLDFEGPDGTVPLLAGAALLVAGTAVAVLVG